MKKLFTLLVVAASSLVACKAPIDMQSANNADMPIENASVPYATRAALDEYSDEAEIVDHKLSRKIALADISINKYYETHNWQGCTLSEEPVIIYGFDNKPLFYDFIVINAKGQNIGMVTLHARRDHMISLAQCKDEIFNYQQAMTRSGQSTFYADRYGNRYVGATATRGGKLNSVVSVDSRSAVEAPEHMTDQELMEYLKNEVYPNIYETPEQIQDACNSLDQRYQEHIGATSQTWAKLDNLNNSGMFDSIPNSFGPVGVGPDAGFGSLDNGGNGGGGYNQPTVDYFIDGNGNIVGPTFPPVFPPVLPPVEDPNKPIPAVLNHLTVSYVGEVAWITECEEWKKIPAHGWCGPWVLSHIFSALANPAYDNLKIVDQKIFDQEGYTVQGGTFRGAMTAPCMNNAIKDYTGDRMWLCLTQTNDQEAYWSIREKAMPVMLLTAANGGMHWIELYGSYRRWRDGRMVKYFIAVDNGSLICKDGRKTREPENPNNYIEYAGYWAMHEMRR